MKNQIQFQICIPEWQRRQLRHEQDEAGGIRRNEGLNLQSRQARQTLIPRHYQAGKNDDHDFPMHRMRKGGGRGGGDVRGGMRDAATSFD